MKVPIAKPWLDEAELASVAGPLTDGWVVQGPRVRAFEARFAEFVGAPHAVAVSSCTTALHAALVALGVGHGDEVIVPALSWVASANSAVYCGATPVFCDVSLEDFNLDVKLLPGLITRKTRAILPVHLFGLPARMDVIQALAKRHELVVVEDAACGFGALADGVHVGNTGAAGCFSFHPRKAITTGDGGMIVTADPELASRCRALRDHGASQAREGGAGAASLLGEFAVIGFNYRMTDIQAAVGLAQMDKARRILDGRTHRARRYLTALADLPWLRLPSVPEGLTHGWQSFVCLFAPEPPDVGRIVSQTARRNALMASLEAAGVATRQGTHAITTLTVYMERYGIRPEDFPNALLADRLSLALPLYPQMTDAEQDHVIGALRAAVP